MRSIPHDPITPAVAAAQLDVDVSLVYRLIRAGRIAAAPWGRTYLVDPASVAAFRPNPRGRPTQKKPAKAPARPRN